MPPMNNLPRTGFGFDVHKLEKSNAGLVIGGVIIPSPHGATGHSDADVLIHAICDALLGAAGLRDIGFHFPDTDPAYKDIDSRKLLKRVCTLLKENNFIIGNIDTTIGLQEPKLSPYIDEIQKSLAEVMDIVTSNISIKATTTEKLGFTGRKEGVVAYAVALIVKNS